MRKALKIKDLNYIENFLEGVHPEVIPPSNPIVTLSPIFFLYRQQGNT